MKTVPFESHKGAAFDVLAQKVRVRRASLPREEDLLKREGNGPPEDRRAQLSARLLRGGLLRGFRRGVGDGRCRRLPRRVLLPELPLDARGRPGLLECDMLRAYRRQEAHGEGCGRGRAQGEELRSLHPPHSLQRASKRGTGRVPELLVWRNILNLRRAKSVPPGRLLPAVCTFGASRPKVGEIRDAGAGAAASALQQARQTGPFPEYPTGGLERPARPSYPSHHIHHNRALEGAPGKARVRPLPARVLRVRPLLA
jgi:hypothetical protein